MTVSVGKVAKQYAKALFELCDPKQLDAAQALLSELANAWRDSSSLRDALMNPGISRDEKLGVVRAIVELVAKSSAGLKRDTFENFACLLLENNRLSELPAIAQAFADLINEMKKMLAVEITSAFPLADDEQQKVLKRIRDEYGQLAHVSWRVDPAILGGLLIKSGDKLLDSSVLGSLQKMRAQLAA